MLGLILTNTEVHSGQQGASPCHRALALAKVLDEVVEEDAKGVSDSVHDQVAHEAGEHDDPAVATVGRRRQFKVGLLHLFDRLVP